MYSNKFAAKLVNIRQLCKKIMDNLNIFIVLSTYYFTFRITYMQPSLNIHFKPSKLSKHLLFEPYNHRAHFEILSRILEKG